MVQAADRPSPLSRALRELSEALAAIDLAELDRMTRRLADASRVFVTGQGRSGLSARMGAMRFMHLGRSVHVVGDVTTPSIGGPAGGDVLLVLSGSGSTPVNVGFAETAIAEGAQVLLITHKRQSPLADLASATLVIPTAATTQFGGTLFEQAALVVLDSIIANLMATMEDPHAQMVRRHANLQ